MDHSTLERIFDDGDLILEVIPERSSDSDMTPVRFLVGSQILCTSSPVFTAMFGRNSSFREREDFKVSTSVGKTPTVKLFDETDTLRTILHALHGKHDKVPRSVDFHMLFDLTIIIDKYKLRQAMQVWGELWSKPYTMERMGIKPDTIDLLFVEWVFKLPQLYADLLSALYFSMSDDDGEVVFVDNAEAKSPEKQPRFRFHSAVPHIITGELCHRCLRARDSSH